MDKVKCPYCGAEMRPDYPTHCTYTCNGKFHARFECPKCRAQSPLGWADTQALAVDTAHAAAMRRWQKPNRVMTWDEVVARCKAGEPIVIQLGDDAANPFYIIGFNQIYEGSVQVFHMRTYRNREYGGTWRCWSHRPTDEERAGAGWLNGNGESEKG